MFTTRRHPAGGERPNRLALGRGLSGLLNRLRRSAPVEPAERGAASIARPAEPAQYQAASLPDERDRDAAPSAVREGAGTPVPPRAENSLRGRLQSTSGDSARPTPATPATGSGARPDGDPVRFVPGDDQVMDVPIDCIHPSDDRAGRDAAPADLRQLAESIRQNGLIQPLVVAPFTATGPGAREFRVIFGDRRLRAARIAGLTRVPAIIRQVAPALGLQHALAEDVNRVPLSAYDRARLLAQLGRAEGLAAPELAARIGRAPDLVEWDLAILTLEPRTQAAVAAGLISEAQCRVILEAPTPELQHKLYALTVRYGWSPARMQVKLAQWGVQSSKLTVQSEPRVLL